jgi:hypothetical protein
LSYPPCIACCCPHSATAAVFAACRFTLPVSTPGGSQVIHAHARWGASITPPLTVRPSHPLPRRACGGGATACHQWRPHRSRSVRLHRRRCCRPAPKWRSLRRPTRSACGGHRWRWLLAGSPLARGTLRPTRGSCCSPPPPPPLPPRLRSLPSPPSTSPPPPGAFFTQARERERERVELVG